MSPIPAFRRSILTLGRRAVPQFLKSWLRKAGALYRLDDTIWELPNLPGRLQMKGPGVFGTYIERLYEPDVTLALMQSVQLGWICVDVGAHLGYFILLMAYLVGDTGRVFAFEALPENVRWLKENVALNGFTDRVTIENQAITDGKQSVVHLHAPLQYTSEWSIVRPSPIARSIAVRATSLEQYFAQGPRVDFIKIDIEGAEFMALQGSQTILRHHRPLCLVELHGEEGQRAVRFLLEMGYGVEGLKGQAFFGPPFPCHILARPGER